MCNFKAMTGYMPIFTANGLRRINHRWLPPCGVGPQAGFFGPEKATFAPSRSLAATALKPEIGIAASRDKRHQGVQKASMPRGFTALWPLAVRADISTGGSHNVCTSTFLIKMIAQKNGKSKFCVR